LGLQNSCLSSAGAGVIVFRPHVRAAVCSRALIGFRKRVRACVRSRAGDFALAGFATCRQTLALPRRGGVMRWGWGFVYVIIYNVIPRLDRGTQYSRRWSRVLCPSDFFLRYGVLRCQNSKAHQDCALLMLHSLKRKAPLGPGSRDGLSVHTVRDDSWRNAGKLCRETSCPPWQALFGFREHVRVRARSRAGATLIALLALPRRGSDAGTFTGCLPSERPRGGLARPRGGVHAQRELP
jgi:hypothetical protein